MITIGTKVYLSTNPWPGRVRSLFTDNGKDYAVVDFTEGPLVNTPTSVPLSIITKAPK